jgi:hypothetical protein
MGRNDQMLNRSYQNAEFQTSQANLCVVAPSTFSIITAFLSLIDRTVFKFACMKQEVPDDGQQVTPELRVLSMELASCHVSCA